MKPIFQKRRIHGGPTIIDITRKVGDMSNEVVVEKKPWWKSKTLWANLVGVALLVAKYFGLIGAADIPPEYAVTGIIGFVINMILRIVSNKKLTATK